MTTSKSIIRRLSDNSYIVSFILGIPIIMGAEKSDALTENWNITLTHSLMELSPS
jgi:undecaprenyl pyrophosphate phosphatase UppP